MNFIKSTLIISCMLFGVYTLGDDHIVINVHTDAHEIMGQKRPATDVTTHIWFNENFAAQDIVNQRIVLDAEKKQARYIIIPQKSYIEMAIPIDFKQYLPEMMLTMMAQVKTTVTVEKLVETKEILGIKCEIFKVLFNSPMGVVVNKIYTSEKMPFDYPMFRTKFEDSLNKMKFQMLDEPGLAKLSKVTGFYMGMDMSTEIMGTKISSSSVVTSMEKAEAPEGTYSTPADFTKLGKIPLPQRPPQ